MSTQREEVLSVSDADSKDKTETYPAPVLCMQAVLTADVRVPDPPSGAVEESLQAKTMSGYPRESDWE